VTPSAALQPKSNTGKNTPLSPIAIGRRIFSRPVESFEAPYSRGEKQGLAAILLGAFALRFLSVTLFPNIYYPDEVFQYLEQGHRLAFGYGVIPWEYRVGSRSWLLPGFLGALMWGAAALGGGVTAYLIVIGGVLSAFSTAGVLVAWLWARRIAGPAAAAVAAIVAAVWVELVYAGPRPMTEALAGTTLFAGAYLLCSCAPLPSRSVVAGGLLLGLTFALRMHLTPAILVIVLYACYGAPVRTWLAVGLSTIAVVAMAGLLDWVSWGMPFQSLWKNYLINVVDGRANRYGQMPWYYYAALYVWTWSGAIVPLAALALVGAWRRPVLLVIPLVIVLSHSAISHKEIRFLYPALPFILLAAAVGTTEVALGVSRAWPRFGKRACLAAAILGWTLTSVVLSVGERFRPVWTRHADKLAAFDDIRNRERLCGLGLVRVAWYNTGGYVHLHRDVPIYVVGGYDKLDTVVSSFDTALGRRESALSGHGFRRARCYSADLCLYERPGPCIDSPARAINEYLRKTDQ
jgi:hypothetical protein